MSTMHDAIAGYIDGLKTAIDRLSLDYEGNEFAKGYRTALDDLGVYVLEVEGGLLLENAQREAGLYVEPEAKDTHHEPR